MHVCLDVGHSQQGDTVILHSPGRALINQIEKAREEI